MKKRRVLLALCAVIAISALTLSCGASSSLLSDSERSSLYTVALNSSEGKAIADGSIIAPGAVIIATISKLPGAADPAALEITLGSGAAKPAVALRAQSAAFKPSGKAALSVQDSAAKTVDKVDGSLPGLAVPSSIAAGAYEVAIAVLDQDGAIQQSSAVIVFIGTPRPLVQSASSFPPSVEPGAPVLLGLSIAVAAEGGEDGVASVAPSVDASWDPWIEWSFDGKSFAEGLFSSGFDKTVWQAPAAAGAYSVVAQVFPAAPPKGKSFRFRATARQEVRVMAIAASGGSGDDFADSLSYLSLLRLDGDFSDAGTRPRTAQPEAFGSPRLDVYASGFGYRLGAQAGVRIPGLMPPSQEDRLVPFSVIARLMPEQGDGAIARFASEDGSYLLVVGLKDWKPYAEFSFDGKTLRSTAAAGIQRSPLTLEAVFKPEGERLEVEWRAEGERIESPSIPLPPAPPSGSAELGGPLATAGVYDGFGLSSGSPSPAYRLASRRKWKASLILAEGFEDGKFPTDSVASGSASAASGSLVLGPGASLALAPAFDPAQGVVVEASITGDRGSVRLDFFAPSGERVFSVSGAGEVRDAAGARLGALEARAGRLSISLSVAEEGYVVSSGDAASVDVPCVPSTLALAVRREGGTGALSIDAIIARRMSAPTVK